MSWVRMEYHWDLRQASASVRFSSLGLGLDYGRRWPDADESFDASETSTTVSLLQLKSRQICCSAAVRPTLVDDDMVAGFSLGRWLCPRRKRPPRSDAHLTSLMFHHRPLPPLPLGHQFTYHFLAVLHWSFISYYYWSLFFHSSFRAVSEQFQSSFTAVLQPVYRNSRAVFEQFQSRFGWVIEQFYRIFTQDLEQFSSSFRAVSVLFLADLFNIKLGY